MIFTDPIEVNPFMRLDDIPASFAQGLNASAATAWYNSPLQQLDRTSEDLGTERIGRFARPQRRVDRETAVARAAEQGVKIEVDEEGLGEGALNLLIARKRETAMREDVLRRAPGGLAASSAYFLTGLGTSLFDPINLAASFIPIARFVGMADDVARAGMAGSAGAAATTAGRVAARVRVGAVEGAAGQALLEPLNIFRASQEQEDYGITDTLLNVGFGVALGAVAHPAIGALGDRFANRAGAARAAGVIDAARIAPDSAAATMRAADVETNAVVFRAQVAAAVDGRVMDTKVLVPERVSDATVLVETRFPRVDELPPTTVGGSLITPRVIAEGKPLYRETNIDGLNDMLRNDLYENTGRTFVSDNPDLAIGQGQNRGVQIEFRPNSVSGEVNPKPAPYLNGTEYVSDLIAPRAVQSITFDGNATGLRGLSQRVLAREFTREVLDDGRVRYTRKMEGDRAAPVDTARVQQAAAKSFEAESDVHFDAQAKADIDAEVAAAPKDADAAQYINESLRDMEAERMQLSKDMGIDPEASADIRAADEFAARAAKYDRAVRMLASCQVRT